MPVNASSLPDFDELPPFKNFTGCAWGVWGDETHLGSVSMLTPEVVARAAKEEIRTGKSVALNWPINFPEKPLFSRKTPEINLKASPGDGSRDDEIYINTQSGTQWDGLRHFGILEHKVLYDNTPYSDIQLGTQKIADPSSVDPASVKLGIHHWAKHGICGRAVFLDIVKFYEEGGRGLPYDPWTSHGFTVEELEAVAKKEGVEFRPADILIIRAGFIRKYHSSTQAEKDGIARGRGTEHFAGIQQSEDMKRFLWNNHFAALASDQPTFEQWPATPGQELLHQTILGLWGMPLGELFDLEALSEECAASGRYTFFFSSWPLNILGGCASPANAAAFF
ncbi:hypothetical protein SISSUDRAFT_1048781 [Sistotremastrum suecicum HHB10207 ss-3]|uniref:Cyclase n=1 Tax=Sistotremastrum suecicum HHB10207 ss-3 TaxID=1314776 RepID=A0A166C9W5_9AGAM|nr:hypothetical protein SISSUDRAFT_1048781 [Sistotremastrum suecicum HHB10207 ss-3]